jgi:alpha-1,6-mannosyltransferase
VKTLHLTSAWHETSGGIATFYRELIAAANRHGHEIRLVVPAAEDRIEEVGPCGRIYHLAAPVAPLNKSYRVLYPSQFLRAGSKIQRILIDERPELVEICDKYNLNYLGGLLRLRLMEQVDIRPVVIGLSCERMDDNIAAYLGLGALGRIFARLYMHWLYFPMFDHHITVSDHTAAELVPAAQGHPVSRSVWVRPMGVDTARFSPARRSESKRAPLLQSCGGDSATALLLYAGRLAPEKNLGLLIDLIEGLPEQHFKLLIAGQGMEREKLERQTRARVPDRVHFLGHIGDRDELADLYANCDVFLHPNPNEPFGIAPLEAMASGLALVAPNAGGVSSYADLSNAWTVEPTGAAFAKAVVEAAFDTDLRRRKTEAALATASRFAWPNAAAVYLRLYAEIHQRHQGGAPTPGMEPAFISTPAAKSRNRAVAGAAGAAKAAFAAWKRWTEPDIRISSDGPCTPTQP